MGLARGGWAAANRRSAEPVHAGRLPDRRLRPPGTQRELRLRCRASFSERTLAPASDALRRHRAHGTVQLSVPDGSRYHDLLRLRRRALREGQPCVAAGPHRGDLLFRSAAEQLVAPALPLRSGGVGLAVDDVWQSPEIAES